MTSITFSESLGISVSEHQENQQQTSSVFLKAETHLDLPQISDEDDDDTLTAASKTVKTMLADERTNNFATPSFLQQQPNGVLTPSPSNASGRVTASPLRVSQSQVTCSSCMKQFDRLERQPKLLDCIHTVCSVCIQEYNARNPAPSLPGSIGGQSIEQTSCPLCQRYTPTPVDKLPLDVVTLAMSENLTLFSKRNCHACDASSETIGDQEGTMLHWDSICGILYCQVIWLLLNRFLYYHFPISFLVMLR